MIINTTACTPHNRPQRPEARGPARGPSFTKKVLKMREATSGADVTVSAELSATKEIRQRKLRKKRSGSPVGTIKRRDGGTSEPGKGRRLNTLIIVMSKGEKVTVVVPPRKASRKGPQLDGKLHVPKAVESEREADKRVQIEGGVRRQPGPRSAGEEFRKTILQSQQRWRDIA